jgi:hypothetical protein
MPAPVLAGPEPVVAEARSAPEPAEPEAAPDVAQSVPEPPQAAVAEAGTPVQGAHVLGSLGGWRRWEELRDAARSTEYGQALKVRSLAGEAFADLDGQLFAEFATWADAEARRRAAQETEVMRGRPLRAAQSREGQHVAGGMSDDEVQSAATAQLERWSGGGTG